MPELVWSLDGKRSSGTCRIRRPPFVEGSTRWFGTTYGPRTARYEEHDMTQYLISVIHPEGGPDWAEDVDMQEVFAKVDAFNQELQDSGSWVFAGGLEPPSSATVVDATGSDVLVTDGPYRRGQGAARRVLGRRGARPGRGPGDRQARARPRAWAPSRSGRSRPSERPSPRRADLAVGSSAPSTDASWRAWLAGSATSTSPRTPPARPWSSRPSAGPPRACHPTRVGG